MIEFIGFWLVVTIILGGTMYAAYSFADLVADLVVAKLDKKRKKYRP